MKIIKYGVLIILAVMLASCNVYVLDSYAMVRVQNFSSRNIYELDLDGKHLGSLARNNSSLYYSIHTEVDSMSVLQSPFSEWKEYFFNESLDKDRRYSIVIFDDDDYFSNDFEIYVFEDYNTDDFSTPTSTPVVTPTPVPDATPSITPLYLIEMDVEGEYVSMTIEGFFEFDAQDNEYQLIEWNNELTLIITLPADVESSRVYLGNIQNLPTGFDFAMDYNGADQYYLVSDMDFMFAVLEWDYPEKELSALFGGQLKIAGTDEYITVSKGVITRIN